MCLWVPWPWICCRSSNMNHVPNVPPLLQPFFHQPCETLYTRLCGFKEFVSFRKKHTWTAPGFGAAIVFPYTPHRFSHDGFDDGRQDAGWLISSGWLEIGREYRFMLAPRLHGGPPSMRSILMFGMEVSCPWQASKLSLLDKIWHKWRALIGDVTIQYTQLHYNTTVVLYVICARKRWRILPYILALPSTYFRYLSHWRSSADHCLQERGRGLL